MLQMVGVTSPQNFWFILQDTWVTTIKSHYHHPEQSSYHKHILTGNNGHINDISIKDQNQASMFFSAISMVFNVTIQINSIDGSSFSSVSINCTNNINPIKIINTRLFMDHLVYEPWVNPQATVVTTHVIAALTFLL